MSWDEVASFRCSVFPGEPRKDGMKIFSDSPLSPEDKLALQNGAAPHEVIFPKKTVSSVLGTPEPDEAFGMADIAFGQPDLESIARSERLKWVHVSSAGFTRYDTPEFRSLVAQRGLIVTNSTSVYARPCAEHVFSFMIAQSRLLPMSLGSLAANGSEEWFGLRNGCESLRGKEVVILGFGGIATELVKLLAPFEMKITAMRRAPRGDEGVLTITPDELPTALATADHVINILPDNAASRNFANAALFDQMKHGVIFHNIGRGTTVDQHDLLCSLRNGKIAAAWLDVTEPEPLPTDHPLRGEPNYFITPHIAGGHRNESTTLIAHFLHNLKCFEKGLPLRDRIM